MKPETITTVYDAWAAGHRYVLFPTRHWYESSESKTYFPEYKIARLSLGCTGQVFRLNGNWGWYVTLPVNSDIQVIIPTDLQLRQNRISRHACR